MQSVLIQRLCDEFFCDTEIIVHPTVREENGLALSSRNRKLNETEIVKAPMLYQCLCTLAAIMMDKKRLVGSVANRNARGLTIGDLKKFGESYCIAKGIDLEYISFHEFATGIALNDNFNILKDIDNNGSKYVISIGGSVGPSTRLIDNIVIDINNNNDKNSAIDKLNIPLLNEILFNDFDNNNDSTFDTKMKQLFAPDSATVTCDENGTMEVKTAHAK